MLAVGLIKVGENIGLPIARSTGPVLPPLLVGKAISSSHWYYSNLMPPLEFGIEDTSGYHTQRDMTGDLEKMLIEIHNKYRIISNILYKNNYFSRYDLIRVRKLPKNRGGGGCTNK